MKKEVKVKYPGSCGELMQGITGENNFHITCPVNLFSVVSLKINKSGIINVSPFKWKAQAAFKQSLEFLGLKNLGADINILSEIDGGKGMASSTADICGVIAAVFLYFKNYPDEKLISEIALKIEPSDGIMFKDICLFDHKKGGLIEKMGSIPDNKLLVIDPGGTIDTISFNNKDLTELQKKNEPDLQKSLEKMREGFLKKDLGIIGSAAQESSILNQNILYKKHLSQVIDISFKFKASGVCVAHSGTVMGIILPPGFDYIDMLNENIYKVFKEKIKIIELKITSGGLCA
ncbi:MAG: GHMP family kinase ATP-binding protein [Candidatus Humimicrobiaceae bacterium]